MATKEQIFEWVFRPCALPVTDAWEVAEVVAKKLVEENGSSHNSAMDAISLAREYKATFSGKMQFIPYSIDQFIAWVQAKQHQ